MVKPDVKHNYYQDLDLPTNASVDDVRKAYRKLALQYHPDRNAGREEECVPRFQAIQAANEILSDPTTKAKYDADRRKAGLYPASTFKPSVPTPGNPYAARSDFPPPPRRTQPGTWQRSQPSTPGPTPTGADRFTNFPRPAGAAPQKNPAADRTQQFRAWQNMNTPARPQYPTQPPPQVPPREPQPAKSPRPGAAPTSNRPRMGRQDTNMPTEEQIRAGMRHGKSQMPQMPSEEEAAQRKTAWQAFMNKKASAPGAKTGQTKPPATPKRTGGFDPNAPGSDERPAPASSHYVHRHRSEDLTASGFPPPPPGPPPTSDPHSPTSPETTRPHGDPLRQFRSRNSNDDAPYAEGTPRASTPYSLSGRGERTQFSSEGLRRSASTRDTTRLSGEGSANSTRARSVDPAARQREAEKARTNKTRAKSTFVPGMYSDSSSPVSTDDEDASKSPEEADRSAAATPAPRDPKDRPKRKPARPSRRFNGSTSQFATASSAETSHTDSEHPSMEQRKKSNNIFSFPIDSETFRSTSGKSRSVEEINMNFSPGTWHGKFNGSGADYFTDAARRPSPGRRMPSTRSGRAATTDSTPASTSPMPPPPPRPTGSDTGSTYASPADTRGFDQAAWNFKDSSWAWPPPPPNPPGSKVPSRRGSRTTSKAPAAGGPTLGTAKSPHVIDDDDNVIEVDRNGNPTNGAQATDDDLDAMDIDSPPRNDQTAPADQTTEGDAVQEPRLYSVPLSEWRQSQAQTQAQHQSQDHRHTSSATRRAERKSAESNFRVNLEDLSRTEPFARNTDGLKNLADLSSTLPFDSKASNALPTRSMEPQKLRLPKLPKIPDAPLRLSRASWLEYAQLFSKYVLLWHMFNDTMLKHFYTREEEAKKLISSGMDWLAATGDAVNGVGGFGSYCKAVKEDEQVRETWNLGHEKHLEAIKAFESMRERVKERTVNGTLPDV